MKRTSRLGLVALAVALMGGTAAAPAAADETSGTSIVYSDTYWKLLAAFPAGYADGCDIWLFLNGTIGVCDGRIDLDYIYPDGTWGPRPWHEDPASPTGWSVEPDPCIGLTDDEYLLWQAYQDFVNGYTETGPDLTGQQVEQYGACWAWSF